MSNIIKKTTPSMDPRIVRPSVLNMGSLSNVHPYFSNRGGSMFQRIQVPHQKCLSCPNAR